MRAFKWGILYNDFAQGASELNKERVFWFYLSKNWTSWNYFHIKNIGVVFPSWTVCICFFMLNPLGNVVGQRVHVNMTRFVTCYNGEFTFTLEYM